MKHQCIATSYLITAVFVFLTTTQHSFADDSSDGMLVLAISSVETADSRADKAYRPVNMPKMGAGTMPHTESEIAKCSDPELRECLLAENRAEAARQFEFKKAALLADYYEAVRHQKDMISRARDSEVGRNILLARDWLASALVENSDGCFCVIHRMDMDEAAFEQSLVSGFDNEYKNLESVYFVRLVLGDLVDKSMDVRVTSTFTTTQRILQIPVTIEVMDSKTSRLVFSKMLTSKVVKNANNVGSVSGNDSSVTELYQECCKLAGKAVAEHFLCDVIFRVVGPKNDDEFIADGADVSVDGKSVQQDEPIRLLKGSHNVAVDMGEDYRLVGSKDGVLKMVLNSTVTKVLKVESTQCNLTVVVKDSTGKDSSFDPSDASIELVPTADGDTISLSSGVQTRVMQGGYTLNVSKSGYADRTQAVDLNHKKNHTLTVVLVPDV